jgi:hypothetical protein
VEPFPGKLHRVSADGARVVPPVRISLQLQPGINSTALRMTG